MKDQEKTKDQLLEDLAALRRRVQELEVSEKALRESGGRYRNFFENVEDACFEFDLKGKCTFCNEVAHRMVGYTREEFMQLDRRQRHPSKEVAERVFKVYNEIYQTGIPGKILDDEVLCKDGKIKLLETWASLIRDEAGNPIGFRGIGRDVTERKRLEAEQERYRNFVENVEEEACFEVDLAGNMTFFNDPTCRIFGYPREELMGMNNRQYTTPETAKKIYKIFNEVYGTGIPVKVFDYEIIQKNGEVGRLDMSASLIRNASGIPTGFRGISRDVTEQKKMEEEQERLREQLNQARNLEAIGTLAGGIAHEFNNLLMGIQGCASLMLLDIDHDNLHYGKLKTIEDQVKKGADLTKQLLGYARGGRYQVVPTKLNELISKTASLFGRTKKEIRIHQKYVKSLWNVEVDQEQIEQALLNLFLNAWEAMPGGGALYLETENIMLDESFIKPYDLNPGPYVKISITDTGVGMDENTLQRIFEPFFTTKEMGRGVGLGLASSYGIIRGHRGIITVESEKGEGTAFKIYLPSSHKEMIMQEQSEGQKIKRQETILFVDDEQIITDMMSKILEGLGYRVLFAYNGEEAVEIYRVNWNQVDLVIMDMIMPGIGGGEAIERIKSINPQVKVLLSSGYSLDGEAKEILDRGGAQAFLQKPFQLKELSKKIKEVLEA